MMDQHPNWSQYADVIKKKCFDCINQSSRVLEIGAGSGEFTKIILEQNPAYVEVIEPDPDMVKVLTNKFGSKIKLLQEDIFSLLDRVYQHNDFDVIVAFGVLYHWPSPFYFLEQLVNKIQPLYICLDNPDNDKIVWLPETTNAPGNYWTNKKTVGISLHLPPDSISHAMVNLGYQQLLKRHMGYHNIPNKEQSWVWKFQRISS